MFSSEPHSFDLALRPNLNHYLFKEERKTVRQWETTELYSLLIVTNLIIRN